MPAGRPKLGKTFAAMLRIALAEASADKKSNKLREVADTLVKEAIAGNVAAIKEIADRMDGKVPQGIMGDEDGPAIKQHHVIERRIVHVTPTDD